MEKPKHKLPRFIAKRKYWIEWHLLIDKYPSKGSWVEKDIERFLYEYIKKYLEKYFVECYRYMAPGTKSISGAENQAYDIPPQLAEFIHDFFDEEVGAEKSVKDNDKLFLEYHKWDKQLTEWVVIPAETYGKLIDANEKEADPDKKQALYYNVFSKLWIHRFKFELKEVSGSQSVFTYRGWFEGRNNIRLSDASGRNDGTMNPPPPPPPPTA